VVVEQKVDYTHFFAFMINMDLESGVFLLESIQSTREIRGLNALGLERKRNNGLRDKHGTLTKI